MTDEFNLLVETLYNRIYAFSTKLSGNKQDAADITQETFIRAYKARDRRQTERKPDAWLFKIAFRCYLDSRRRATRRPETVSLEYLNRENYTFDPADPTDNPEEVFFNDKLSAPMATAFAALTEQQRSLMNLAHLKGLSHQELSEVFGCGATTIKTRIHRIHMALKSHLAMIEIARTIDPRR